METTISEERCRLRNGRAVVVRQLRGEDAPELARVAANLSERSRYLRFQTAIRELSPETLAELTDIDHHDHEALVAVVPGAADIVGVARFVRESDAPNTAELAIEVADDWQHQGVGTLLMTRLARRAAELGISHFNAEILSENTPMLAFARAFGEARLDRHGSTVTVRTVNPEAGEAREERGAQRWLRALAELNAVLFPRVTQATMRLSADVIRTVITLPVALLCGDPVRNHDESRQATSHVRVAIYAVTSGTAKELADLAQEAGLGLFRCQPGFKSYGLAETQEGKLISVSRWESDEQAERANELAADWVGENLADRVRLESSHVGEFRFFASS